MYRIIYEYIKSQKMYKNFKIQFSYIFFIFYIVIINYLIDYSIAGELNIYQSQEYQNVNNEFINIELYSTNLDRIKQIFNNLDITYKSFKEIIINFKETEKLTILNSLENVKVNNEDNITKIYINLNYPVPYKLIKKELYNNLLTIKIPLNFKVINKIEFYDKKTNKIFAYLYNNYIVEKFNNKSNAINVIIFNFLVPYKVDFINLDKKNKLEYKYDSFYIAINGTYFARKDDKYFTVAGVVDDNNIISFPVEYRPNRGYFSILKDKDNKSFITIFDYLTNIRYEFIKLVNTTKKMYDIDILLQSGPLIYKDYSYVMDLDKEAFGEKGNNIIKEAARTLIVNTQDNTLNIISVIPYNYERNKGLNIYDIPNFLSNLYSNNLITNIKDVLNLDGGSSVNFYINSNLINSVYSNKINPYKSQNYLIFKTDIKDYYYKNSLTYYYYFPGVVDYFYNEKEIIKKKGKYFITFNNGITTFDKFIDF